MLKKYKFEIGMIVLTSLMAISILAVIGTLIAAIVICSTEILNAISVKNNLLCVIFGTIGVCYELVAFCASVNFVKIVVDNFRKSIEFDKNYKEIQ